MSILTPLILGQRTVKGWQSPHHVREFQTLYNKLLYTNWYSRLALVCPVRHAKTWFWAWMGLGTYLMNHPDRRVAYISHANLADEFGYKIRQTIETYGQMMTGVTLARDTRSICNFKTTCGGGLACYSAGNPISGFGYDFILVDDIQKKQEELDSILQRDKIWRWFYSDALNRLTPNGRIAVIMARRHPDDLLGRLKEHNMLSDLPQDKRWAFKTFDCFPTETTALWPDEWSYEKLRAIEKDYELAGNSYLFQCLYRGDPLTSPAGLEWSASMFQDVEYDEIPKGTVIKLKICALDPSKGRNSRKGDFAAMCHLLIDTTGTVWVDDIRLVRLPGPQLEDSFTSWMESHECDAAGIESDLDGGSLAEFITRKLVEQNKLNLANKVWNMASQGLGEKAERLRRDLSRLLANKKLKFRRTGHYRLALSQFRNFSPHGHDHDDACDAVSIGVRTAIRINS